MAGNAELLRVQDDIIINIANVTYIELTGKGGADLHFVGKTKPLHLKANEAGPLRGYITKQQRAREITAAA